MCKVLLASKSKTNNPFMKFNPKYIEEKFVIYHEDWTKFEQIKQKWINEGYKVWEFEMKEDTLQIHFPKNKI